MEIPGLEFETWGLGLTHMAEGGEPEECAVCHGEREVPFVMDGDVLDVLPCPRGC